MITQKAISLKLNKQILEELDKEASLGFHGRNWHINQAVRMYLRVIDSRRLIGCLGSKEDQLGELRGLLEELLPGSKWI